MIPVLLLFFDVVDSEPELSQYDAMQYALPVLLLILLVVFCVFRLYFLYLRKRKEQNDMLCDEDSNNS